MTAKCYIATPVQWWRVKVSCQESDYTQQNLILKQNLGIWFLLTVLQNNVQWITKNVVDV